MTYYVIGLMSGTSLDGLDIAACKFDYHTHDTQNTPQKKWDFEILATKTVTYSDELKMTLQNAHLLSSYDYVNLNNMLGDFFANSVNQFIDYQQNNLKNTNLENTNLENIKFDFIASHGHTIFHQPNKQLTTQIGNGAVIAALTKLPVVCDFRTTDVALQGQGAPLVPIGDKLLFGDYDFCLNLGGIANISTEIADKRIAFDICHANMVLNNLANRLGFDYDDGGNLARKGNFETTKTLFAKLNALEFYEQKAPKSLGREWFSEKILPMIEDYLLEKRYNNQANSQENSQMIYDLLSCFTHHIAYQIAKEIKIFSENSITDTTKNKTKNTLFITGGGAFNGFLIELLQFYAPNITIIIPSQEIIQFKEALIFAFLGVLRWRNEPNALQSVTGATQNSCGGCIYAVYL